MLDGGCNGASSKIMWQARKNVVHMKGNAGSRNTFEPSLSHSAGSTLHMHWNKSMLISITEACILDISSACCRERAANMGELSTITQATQLSTCSNRQLHASREMVLGTLYTVSTHYLPSLFLKQGWHRCWNGKRPALCYFICCTNLVHRSTRRD